MNNNDYNLFNDLNVNNVNSTDLAHSSMQCLNNFETVNHNTASLSSYPISRDLNVNANLNISNLMAWNIQGLRPKLFNHDFKEFCKIFDVFSLSEIQGCTEKLMRDSFPQFEVFTSFRTICKGGGVAVFIKKKIVKYICKISNHAEECLFFLVKKSLFSNNIETDVIFCFPYIAHEYSSLYDDLPVKGIELFEQNLNHIFNKVGYLPCIIVGDLNSRVGTLSDIIRVDYRENCYNDLSDLSPIIVDIDLPDRTTSDLEINLFGRDLVRFCKNNDLCILNGRKEGDRQGKITCIANGGRSVVDYAIICKSIYNVIEEIQINPRAESDHFPVCLTFGSKAQNNISVPTRANLNYSSLNYSNKYNWKEYNQDTFFNHLNMSLIENKSIFLDNLVKRNIDSAVSILNGCITNLAVNQCYKIKNNAKKQPGWFNKECE